jgi:hypothetical protein
VSTHAARGRLGGLRRSGAPPGQIQAAQAELKFAEAAAYIQRLTSEPPHLTPAQLSRLAHLLDPGDDAA